jgi:two-component system, OmpR family, phosphate regulon sensor histidine kinase PhoR
VLEPLAERSRTRLVLTPLDGPARVQGDREEIVQVLQNLVHNAIKYGREGGHVEIAIGREDGRLALAASDDGPGIAPEHLPRLTERFYRVSVASSREKGGTGLGLAIVKHVLARHRANLRIASRVGEGSTFTAVFEELR